MNYEIFSDVSLDIDPCILEQHPLRFVPMEYMLGSDSYCCERPESNEMMHHYYDKLREKVPTKTSQITPIHYVDAFRPCLEQGIPILYLSLSSGLSDTYNSACMAIQMLKEDFPDVPMEAVDTLAATGGMGLLAESAIKNREAGMSLSDNANWLRANALRVHHWFKVEDLMYLKRGGRVSAATAIVGTALNLKPILTINREGKLESTGTKRGNKAAHRHLVELFEANYDPSYGNSVYICCSDCLEDAEQLKSMLKKNHEDLDVHITMLSPIIGAHTGPDMISVVFYGKQR